MARFARVDSLYVHAFLATDLVLRRVPSFFWDYRFAFGSSILY